MKVEECSVNELGVLASSFNRMAHQLRESFSTLAKTNEELELRIEERTAYLTAIIDNLADGLLVVDLNGKIVRVNPALFTLFGFENTQWSDRNCEIVFNCIRCRTSGTDAQISKKSLCCGNCPDR